MRLARLAYPARVSAGRSINLQVGHPQTVKTYIAPVGAGYRDRSLGWRRSARVISRPDGMRLYETNRRA
jgi:hypothetical protein